MKVVNTKTLISLVRHSRALGFNRLMSKAVERQLDQNGLHILSQPMIHGDVESIRCLVVLCKLAGSEEPHQGQLDFSIDEYNRLPEKAVL